MMKSTSTPLGDDSSGGPGVWAALAVSRAVTVNTSTSRVMCSPEATRSALNALRGPFMVSLGAFTLDQRRWDAMAAAVYTMIMPPK